MAPIDLFFWPTPNGWKITLMLEECELPYDIKYVDLSKQEQFEPDFLKISPNGRMPAIVDPEGPGGAQAAVAQAGDEEPLRRRRRRRRAERRGRDDDREQRVPAHRYGGRLTGALCRKHKLLERLFQSR